MHKRTTALAFSLVELSIVLVILGLLTGGILAGQSLIRAAELRSITGEYQRYITAAQTFRDKYFALPGDITNATKFWGVISTGTCYGGTGTGTQTCNGDGDGEVENSGAGNFNESFMFWQHLANAGLIEGTYTGKAGALANCHSTVGVNVPKPRMNGAWNVRYEPNHPGDGAIFFAYDYRTMLYFGDSSSTCNTAAVIKVDEAWGIDTKLDDGKPYSGKLIALRQASCTTATNQTDTTAVYELNEPSIACGLIFPKAFN